MKFLFTGKACTHPCQYNSDGIHGEGEEDSDKTAAGLYFCFTSADNFTRAGCGYHPKEDRQVEREGSLTKSTALQTLAKVSAASCLNAAGK